MLRHRRLPLLVTALVLALGTTSACSDLDGTEGKTWITGEGSLQQVPAGERGKPVEVTGDDLDGDPLDLADYRGKVVVLNVYASWCPPCRAEMPTVVQLAEHADAAQVAYLGVSIRDNDSAARAFGENFGIGFPSFSDPSSAVLLALSDKLGPYSLPSTVVLDREGRVAALVLGKIPGAVTMQDVVDDVVAEGVAEGVSEAAAEGAAEGVAEDG
jgi:thiol-disulfide isomerase/thioredoxin